jgi:murein DD-endopeptidase MepM/ murein hydrolase activator NlpD
MSQITVRIKFPKWVLDVPIFVKFLRKYVRVRGYERFSQFEKIKDLLVDLLYKRRGRYARPFLHFGTISLIFFVVTFGPFLLREDSEAPVIGSQGILSSVDVFATDFNTVQSDAVRQYRGGEIITHLVQEGETLSQIASRYGLQVDTVLWENDLTEKSILKPNQELRILPVDGVRHKVSRGETIFSIGKKYGLQDESQVQVVVDYPFNEFLNEETFELATGQFLMVPGGTPPRAPTQTTRPTRVVALTPDAGTVTATGSFVWPAAGRITQGYFFYHKAIDIANRSGGQILSADSGVVTVAGWIDNGGYGNRVQVDHGNGFVTLYAHLSSIQVRPGQRVNRGDVLGQMGSTGRSTGVHLHFEIRQGGVLLNPLNFLQ